MAITLNGTTGISTPAITNSGTLTQTGAATLSSTLQSASTIGVGGATPAASGAGITFPATQSASTDANTLDDYEEGTWTPTIARTGSSYTFGSRTGTYTKIGRQVTVQCYVNITAITTQGSSYITVTGLPFACMNSSESNFTGSIFYNTAVSSSSAMSTGIFKNETFFYLKSTTRGEDPINENTAVGYIMATLTYFTS